MINHRNIRKGWDSIESFNQTDAQVQNLVKTQNWTNAMVRWYKYETESSENRHLLHLINLNLAYNIRNKLEYGTIFIVHCMSNESSYWTIFLFELLETKLEYFSLLDFRGCSKLPDVFAWSWETNVIYKTLISKLTN